MSEPQWHYHKDNAQHGPITETELAELLSRGELEPSALIWTAGMSGWKPANQVPGLPVSVPEVADTPGKRRPTSATVFGILGIVFGGLALLCSPFAIAATQLTKQTQGFSDTVQAWTVFSYGLGVLFGLFQLVFGIGLLKMKPWARKWFVRYGWVNIVWTIASIVFTVALAQLDHYGEGPQRFSAMVGGVIGGLIGMIYPILIIVFLSRSHVKAAYGE